MPVICHVLKNNCYHFIVVYKINKNNIEVMDPSSNIYKIKYDYFKSIYQGTSIVIYPIREISGFKYNNLFKYVFDSIKQEKKNIIKIIIYSLLTIIISILVNYYLVISIDKIIPKFNNKIFIIFTCLFMNLYLIKNILEFIKTKYLIIIENNIYSKLNMNIIRKVFNLPYHFFKSISTGEVMTRINDLLIFKNNYFNILVNIILNSLFIIFSSIILISINSNLFIIILIEMVLYILFIIAMKNKYIKYNECLLEKYSDYNKVLNDNINSYEIDNNLNVINNSFKKLEISFICYIHSIKKNENYLNLINFIKNLILDIGYIISIYISVLYLHKGLISIGELFLFNSLMFYLIEPIKNLTNIDYDYIYIKNVFNRISDLLLVKPNNYLESNKSIVGEVRIKNLSYKIDEYIFKNVSFNIPYGSKFLIYGSSGSGKSTIIKIMLKYLNEYEGNVYIDDINLKDISRSIIANSFTYVSQNSYLINDTLKNNIIYNRKVSDIEYERIIKICNLVEFRDSKKSRDEYMIEDNGFNISGGQKQKIVIARSLLKESKFIVLDEALSEIGIDEEKMIIKNIFDFYKNKTIIYISHKKEIIKLFKNNYYLERSGLNVK